MVSMSPSALHRAEQSDLLEPLDRRPDVERTARELTSAQRWRAEFYRRHAGPKASKKQLIDAFSVIDDDVSDAEYRLMRFRLYYCNEACDNYFGSTELEAALLPRSVSAIERASKGLEGPDNYQTSKRRRNDSSLRSFDVPDCKRQTAKELLALLETAYLRVENGSETANLQLVDSSETADLRLVPPETANLQSRNRKNAHLTLKDNSIKKDNRGNSASIAEQARELYNDYAARHRFQACRTPSEKLNSRLAQRLKEIGGLEKFALALSVIHQNDFLMGRLPPPPGKRPFKLDLEFLLSTGSKMDDVLAKLVDKALDIAETIPSDDFEAEVTRFAETSAGRTMLQSFREREKGMDLIRKHLRDQRQAGTGSAKPANGAGHG